MVQCHSVKCTYNFLFERENIVSQGTVKLTSTLAAALIRHVTAHMLMFKCKFASNTTFFNIHNFCLFFQFFGMP